MTSLKSSFAGGSSDLCPPRMSEANGAALLAAEAGIQQARGRWAGFV